MPSQVNTALTVKDVAKVLSVDEKTIYRLVQTGRLPGFKVAGAWRFQRRDLDMWIEERKRVAATRTTKLARPRGG